MAQFNVTELDFQKIKDSIVDHFRSQSKYNDWDFEGSGLSTLLDVLAYNTHYNAMVAHFSLNESFLDSAQIRGNVVSHAKLVGYVPRSTRAAVATLNVTVTGNPTSPSIVTLERGTRFKTSLNNTTYNFVALNSIEASKNTVNGTYAYPNIQVYQGTLKRMLYLVDNSIPNQKFVIPETNVDTTTLRVRVKANQDSDEYSIYTPFTTLAGIGAETLVYFTQENASGNYEVYFGDGILGKKPISNNVVEVEYLYTSGPVANGSRVFSALDTIGEIATSGISVSTVSVSSGGDERESIESIRYNAPFTYLSQNRAVTADDYRSLILKEFGGIDAVSVWGGENNIEPDFGKVYISVKPSNAPALTTVEKNNIISALKSKNIVSITPIIVDPEYTYIKLDTFFKYNPNLTDRTKAELEALIRSRIGTYAETYLQRFDGVFRYSKLLSDIDSSDPAILNSVSRVSMHKSVTPRATGTNYWDLTYSTPIYSTNSTEPVMTSSTFVIGGVEHFLQDVPKENSFDRTIYLYKTVSGVETKLNAVGTVYASAGRIVVNAVQPDTTASIRIEATPNSFDLAPKRNQLLDIDLVSTTITGEIDTIALAGAAGAINYTTTSRHA
jgi:hypothetical protein